MTTICVTFFNAWRTFDKIDFWLLVGTLCIISKLQAYCYRNCHQDMHNKCGTASITLFQVCNSVKLWAHYEQSPPHSPLTPPHSPSLPLTPPHSPSLPPHSPLTHPHSPFTPPHHSSVKWVKVYKQSVVHC